MIFDSLHHKSRVWVYISSKPLTSYTKNKITCSFNDFKSSWKSHGEQLEGNLKFHHSVPNEKEYIKILSDLNKNYAY